MSFGTFKGYVLVVVCGLVLLAATLLVVLQWGNQADFSLYGMNVKVNTAGVIIVSAVSAVAAIVLARLFWYGVQCLRKGRREQARKDTETRLRQFEKSRDQAKQDPPESAE